MLKMIAVRVPETTHKYLKTTAVKKDKSLQELVNQIFYDYQKKDHEYQSQMQASLTDALNGLANLQRSQSGDSHA